MIGLYPNLPNAETRKLVRHSFNGGGFTTNSKQRCLLSPAEILFNTPLRGAQRTAIKNYISKQFDIVELFQKYKLLFLNIFFQVVPCVSASQRENCFSRLICAMLFCSNNRNVMLISTISLSRIFFEWPHQADIGLSYPGNRNEAQMS